MTFDEAYAYLLEHAMTPTERAVYDAIETLWEEHELRNTSGFPLNMITILVQFLTEIAYAKMVDAHRGDPEGCADVLHVFVNYVEAMLMAKVMLAADILQGGEETPPGADRRDRDSDNVEGDGTHTGGSACRK